MHTFIDNAKTVRILARPDEGGISRKKQRRAILIDYMGKTKKCKGWN